MVINIVVELTKHLLVQPIQQSSNKHMYEFNDFLSERRLHVTVVVQVGSRFVIIYFVSWQNVPSCLSTGTPRGQ